MASAFNLTAQLNLRGPSNIATIVADIRKQIGSIDANINFRLDPNVARNVGQLNAVLSTFNRTLTQTSASANDAASALRNLGTAINGVRAQNLSQTLGGVNTAAAKTSQTVANTSRAISTASSEMAEFGRQSGLAIRRFAAFSTVTGVVYGVVNAINQGISSYIEYDRQLVKLQQVTGQSAKGLQSLEQAITNLSTSYGVGSMELTEISSTLAQAGLSAKDTEKALKALALSSLAPSFDSMNETVEGSIALMRQFGIGANDLEKALGSVNSVAARFAVEASDLITAIQRTGGVFATASKGVSEGTDALNEFLAVFTSIRATTRESAETIATGLRTIFTRIQREDTINALKEYGVNLTDLDGKFVGAYKAVELLSKGLSTLDPRDLKFSRIVEELGGFRQIGKVIPLIQQFSTAQDALKVAQTGQGSLAADAAKAQESLAIQIAKVRQEFLALFREIGKTDSFQTIVKGALSVASALIKVADSVKGFLPVLGVMLAFKGASAITQFGSGFLQGVRGFGGARGLGQRLEGGKSEGGEIKYFASGGLVPGSGNIDSVNAKLTPGEFVMRKNAVRDIGAGNLYKMNSGVSTGIDGFALGGKIKDLSQNRYGKSSLKQYYDTTKDFDTYSPPIIDRQDLDKTYEQYTQKATAVWTEANKRYKKDLSSGYVPTKGEIPQLANAYIKGQTRNLSQNLGYKELREPLTPKKLNKIRGALAEADVQKKYNLGKPLDPQAGADFYDTAKNTFVEVKNQKQIIRDETLQSKALLAYAITYGRKLNNKPDNIPSLKILAIEAPSPDKFDEFDTKNAGGLIQKFMAGGVAKTKKPKEVFGTGETTFPARIRKKYAEEKQRSDENIKAKLTWDEHPQNERIMVDDSKVQEAFQQSFDKAKFVESFKQKITRNTIFSRMADFAKFIGLPQEDLTRTLPLQVDFGGPEMSLLASAQFKRGARGTRPYDGYDLSKFGYGESQKQELYGLEKLIEAKQKEIKKITKTPTRTFDDGSFSFDNEAYSKANNELRDLKNKSFKLKDIKREAEKKILSEQETIASSTGKGTISFAKSLGYSSAIPNSTLYHELTHQLFEGLRKKSEDSFVKYKARVTSLFSGDNDDLSDAFDTLTSGGGYSSADVVYGRSYKQSYLSSMLSNYYAQNPLSNSDKTKEPIPEDITKNLASLSSQSKATKKAKEFKIINPKINQALTTGKYAITQDVLNRLEDSGKEEFLTTLIEKAPQLDQNLQGILDSTLTELLSGAGIQRQRYATGGYVQQFAAGGKTKPQKEVISSSPTPMLQAILARIEKKPIQKEYSFRSYQEELSSVLNQAYKGILMGGTKPIKEKITRDSIVSMPDQYSNDDRYIDVTVGALEDDLKYITGGDTQKGSLKKRKGVEVGDMLDVIRSYQGLGLDYTLNAALASGRTNETLGEFQKDLPEVYKKAGLDKVKLSTFVKQMDAAAQFKFPEKLYSGLGDSKLDLILKGTNTKNQQDLDNIVGKTFTMPSFLSASDAEALATSFARVGMLTILTNPKRKGIIPEKSKETTINRESQDERSKKSRILQAVTGQKGMFGFHIDEHYTDAYDSEGEYIFPSNSKFKINSIEKSTAKLFDKDAGYRHLDMEVQQLAKGGAVQRFAKGNKVVINRGVIDADDLMNPQNASVVRAEMEKLGISNIYEYKIHLDNLAASRNEEKKNLSKFPRGQDYRLVQMLGAKASGKSTQSGLASGGTKGNMRETNVFSILTPADVQRADHVISTTSVEGPNQLQVIKNMNRAHVLSSRHKDSQQIILDNEKYRDNNSSLTLFGRKPGATKGASPDSGYAEAYLAAHADSDRVVTRKVIGRGKYTRIDQPTVRSPERTMVYMGNFGPSTSGHVQAAEFGSRKTGISPQDSVIVVSGDASIDFRNPNDQQTRTAIFPQQSKTGPSRLGMAQATFGARGFNVAATPKGTAPGAIPNVFKVGEDSYIVPRGKNDFAVVGDEKDDKVLKKYKDSGYSVVTTPRIGGISGTAARNAIMKNDVASMKKLLSPEGFQYIQQHLDILQKRPQLLDSILARFVSNSSSGRGMSGRLSSVMSQLSTLPARKTKTTPPETVALMEFLRKQRDDLSSRLGRRPGRVLERLELMRSRKFADAGAVSASSGKSASRSDILKVLNLNEAAVAAGISPTDVYEILGKRNPNAQQEAWQKAIREAYLRKTKQTEQDRQKKIGQLTSKGLAFGAAGMFGTAFPAVQKTLSSPKLKNPIDVYITSGVMDPVQATKLDQTFSSSMTKTSKRAAKRLMVDDILRQVGLGKTINLDFDRTLALGADKILANPKQPKFAEFSDPIAVQAALQKSRLTLLGKELAKTITAEPSLLSNLRIITARPAKTLGFIQNWLVSQGLPIPLNQFSGVGGPGISGSQIPALKAALLSKGSVFVDDDRENIREAKKKGGIRTYRYGSDRIKKDTNTEATAQGTLFEYLIQSLGGPKANSSSKSIDFPNGLKGAAKYFNIKSNIPTDAKRTLNGPSTVEDNIVNYLSAKGYSLGGLIQKYTQGGKPSRKVSHESGVGQSPFETIKSTIDYYSLEKTSGFNSTEFNELVRYAKINNLSIAEFKKYLTQRTAQKKEKSNLATNPKALQQFLLSGTTRPQTTDKQRDLARSLMGEPDAGYRPLPRYADGGTIPALVSNGEAFVPPDTARKIGYSTLHRMNRADTNGMGKFGGGGGISVFKGPGTGTSDSIGPVDLPVGSFILREKATKALGLYAGGGVGIQSFADGGDPSVRPESISSSTIPIGKANLEQLIASLTQVGIAASRTSQLLFSSSVVSIKAAEQAAKADVDRAKAAGASIDKIIGAEKVLTGLREAKNAQVGKGNILKSVFSGAPGLSSGAAQQRIVSTANDSAKKQITKIEAQNEKDLITNKKSADYDRIVRNLIKKDPFGDINQIQKEASARVIKRTAAGKHNLTDTERASTKLSDDRRTQIYERATLRATSDITGVSRADLKKSGIGAGDIRKYAEESTMDRKTLAAMDKEYRSSRKAELLQQMNAERGVTTDKREMARRSREAVTFVEQELQARRKMANDMARAQGVVGPGGTGLLGSIGYGVSGFGRAVGRKAESIRTNFLGLEMVNGESNFIGSKYQGFKGAAGNVLGFGANIANKIAGPNSFMAGMAISMLAGQGENVASMLGGNKRTRAGIAAGLESGVGTFAAGLALTGQAATMTGPFAPIVAGVGLAATAIASWRSGVEASSKALKEFDNNLKDQKAQDANEALAKALEDLSKNVGSIDLQKTLNNRLQESLSSNNATSSRIFDEKKSELRADKIGKMSTMAWIGSFVTGVPESTSKDLSASDYKELARKQIPRYEEDKKAAIFQAEMALKQGKSIDDISADDAFKPLREALARTDLSVLPRLLELDMKEGEAREKASKAVTNAEKQHYEQIANNIAAERQGVINQSTANNQTLLGVKKTVELNKAMEEAAKAAREVTQTFATMARLFDQAVNKVSFALEGIADSAENTINALTGTAKIGNVRSKDANVLANPSVYSEKEVNETSRRVAKGIFNPNAAGLSPEEKAKREKNVSEVEQVLKLNTENIAKKVSSAAGKVSNTADFNTVAGAMRGQLNKEIEGLPEQVRNDFIKSFNKIVEDVQNAPELLPEQKANKLVELTQDQLAKASSDAAKEIQNMGIQYANTATKGLNEFINATNRATQAQLKALELNNKAKDIRTEGAVSLREFISGGSIGLGERASIVNDRVSRLTGGTTDPAQIRATIEQKTTELNAKKDQLQKDLDNASSEENKKQLAEKYAQDTSALTSEINKNQQALEELANSTELATAAMNQLQALQKMQADRLQNIDQILTSSPKELRKFNESLVRIQQRAMGINPSPSREAQRAYNRAFRQSGGNARVATMAAQEQLAQDRAMDLRTMEQYRSTFVLNQMNANPGMSQADANDLYNRGAANVRGQMAFESGAARMYGPGLLQGIMAGANPMVDPAFAATVGVYNDANERQAKANEQKAALETASSLVLLKSASDSLAQVFDGLSSSFNGMISRLEELGIKVVKDGKPVEAAVGKANGGIIYASLGKFIDFQPKGTDTVPAMLTPGEFVVNARATAQHLPLLQAINSGANAALSKTMSRGGVVYLSAGGKLKKDETIEQDRAALDAEVQAQGAAYAAGNEESQRDQASKAKEQAKARSQEAESVPPDPLKQSQQALADQTKIVQQMVAGRILSIQTGRFDPSMRQDGTRKGNMAAQRFAASRGMTIEEIQYTEQQRRLSYMSPERREKETNRLKEDGKWIPPSPLQAEQEKLSAMQQSTMQLAQQKAFDSRISSIGEVGQAEYQRNQRTPGLPGKKENESLPDKIRRRQLEGKKERSKEEETEYQNLRDKFFAKNPKAAENFEANERRKEKLAVQREKRDAYLVDAYMQEKEKNPSTNLIDFIDNKKLSGPERERFEKTVSDRERKAYQAKLEEDSRQRKAQFKAESEKSPEHQAWLKARQESDQARIQSEQADAKYRATVAENERASRVAQEQRLLEKTKTQQLAVAEQKKKDDEALALASGVSPADYIPTGSDRSLRQIIRDDWQRIGEEKLARIDRGEEAGMVTIGGEKVKLSKDNLDAYVNEKSAKEEAKRVRQADGLVDEMRSGKREAREAAQIAQLTSMGVRTENMPATPSLGRFPELGSLPEGSIDPKLAKEYAQTTRSIDPRFADVDNYREGKRQFKKDIQRLENMERVALQEKDNLDKAEKDSGIFGAIGRGLDQFGRKLRVIGGADSSTLKDQDQQFREKYQQQADNARKIRERAQLEASLSGDPNRPLPATIKSLAKKTEEATKYDRSFGKIAKEQEKSYDFAADTATNIAITAATLPIGGGAATLGKAVVGGITEGAITEAGLAASRSYMGTETRSLSEIGMDIGKRAAIGGASAGLFFGASKAAKSSTKAVKETSQSAVGQIGKKSDDILDPMQESARLAQQADNATASATAPAVRTIDESVSDAVASARKTAKEKYQKDYLVAKAMGDEKRARQILKQAQTESGGQILQDTRNIVRTKYIDDYRRASVTDKPDILKKAQAESARLLGQNKIINTKTGLRYGAKSSTPPPPPPVPSISIAIKPKPAAVATKPNPAPVTRTSPVKPANPVTASRPVVAAKKPKPADVATSANSMTVKPAATTSPAETVQQAIPAPVPLVRMSQPISYEEALEIYNKRKPLHSMMPTDPDYGLSNQEYMAQQLYGGDKAAWDFFNKKANNSRVMSRLDDIDYLKNRIKRHEQDFFGLGRFFNRKEIGRLNRQIGRKQKKIDRINNEIPDSNYYGSGGLIYASGGLLVPQSSPPGKNIADISTIENNEKFFTHYSDNLPKNNINPKLETSTYNSKIFGESQSSSKPQQSPQSSFRPTTTPYSSKNEKDVKGIEFSENLIAKINNAYPDMKDAFSSGIEKILSTMGSGASKSDNQTADIANSAKSLTSIIKEVSKENTLVDFISKNVLDKQQQPKPVTLPVRTPQQYATGGIVYANNGILVSAQARGTDTVPAMLTPGEFVINRDAAQKNLPILQAINKGYYNQGGIVQYLASGGAVAPIAPKYLAAGGMATQHYAAGGQVTKSKHELDAKEMREAVDSFKQTVSEMGQKFAQLGESVSTIPREVTHNMQATVTQHVTGINGAEQRYQQQFDGKMDQVARHHTSQVVDNLHKSSEGAITGGNKSGIIGRQGGIA